MEDKLADVFRALGLNIKDAVMIIKDRGEHISVATYGHPQARTTLVARDMSQEYFDESDDIYHDMRSLETMEPEGNA
jgi:hypothetical protein